jgi:predicted NAD/FAD-binding protein
MSAALHAKPRIAVVGAGIAGLSSAWLLERRYDVTLFEAAGTLGGHSNTVDVTLDGATHPVDTGFLVYNERTYPNLVALFNELGVDSVESEMSFAVSLAEPDLEWAGSSLATLFGQKRNLLRADFWAMLGDILRFNREATRWLAAHPEDTASVGDFLERGRYSRAFAQWYLLPMAAAIWSCPTGQMRAMPLATFVRFCDNHGLLQIFDRPRWRTVRGGAREYVRRIAQRLADVRTACPVVALTRDGAGWRVDHAHGSERFDQVVLACHSDQSLAILGNAASAAQRELLAAIRYEPNRAVLHSDAALLPRDPKLWSAWNYFAGNAAGDAREGGTDERPVGVSYLINKLQPLPFSTPVVVTLNPAREPAAERVIAEFDYAHPVFDAHAIAAQDRLAALQGENGIWLAGAWGRYGFHEDGLRSALAVANALGVRAPWQEQGAGGELRHLRRRVRA